MSDSQRRRLFKTVGIAGLVYWLSSLICALAISPFIPRTQFSRGMVAITVTLVVGPAALASWWLAWRLRTQHSATSTRRGARAFAFSAPITLAIGYAVGELVGGYAEAFLGSRLILPAILLFVAVLMVTIPGVVVHWALHPSGGVEPVSEGSR